MYLKNVCMMIQIDARNWRASYVKAVSRNRFFFFFLPAHVIIIVYETRPSALARFVPQNASIVYEGAEYHGCRNRS